MARYSAYLGRRVEVQYRAGDILLPATGTLVADSGRSIFLEEHFIQRGQEKHFRWEIPYQYIVKIEERSAVVQAAPEPAPAHESATPRRAAAASSESPLLPLRHRPKEA